MRLVLCAAGAYTEFSLTHRLNILDFCFLINNAAKSSSPPELALTFPACLFPKKMTFGSGFVVLNSADDTVHVRHHRKVKHQLWEFNPPRQASLPADSAVHVRNHSH